MPRPVKPQARTDWSQPGWRRRSETPQFVPEHRIGGQNSRLAQRVAGSRITCVGRVGRNIARQAAEQQDRHRESLRGICVDSRDLSHAAGHCQLPRRDRLRGRGPVAENRGHGFQSASQLGECRGRSPPIGPGAVNKPGPDNQSQCSDGIDGVFMIRLRSLSWFSLYQTGWNGPPLSTPE